MSDIQTVEQTSKKWKTAQLVGAVLMLLSFGACFAGSPEGVFVFLGAGLITYLYGRVGAWWNHG